MNINQKYRQCIPESRRIVVKIGSRVIVQPSGRPDLRHIRDLVKDVSDLRKRGYEIVMVSSGAIAAGMEALGLKERPKSVPDLQMCAAIGQAKLISLYERMFAEEREVVGQVLLTHDDFESNVRRANLRRSMEHLICTGAIPIINENDVVADEEVKAYLSLGDNDYLASLVVKQVRADTLIVLSTTDGLRDTSAGGRNKRIPVVVKINRETFKLVAPQTAGGVSKGGMSSKLKAAASCVNAGCNVVIADGRKKNTITKVVDGDDIGTLFVAAPL